MSIKERIMSAQPCQARIRGLPTHPHIKEINVRAGPGTCYEIAFKGPVGMSGLEILDVQEDEEGKNLRGKVYQWFKLVFHGGAVGWVRDDLLDIRGDCANWGYKTLDEDTFTFALQREPDEKAQEKLGEEKTAPEKPAAKTITGSQPTAKTATASTTAVKVNDLERIKKAAFAVTAAFEGSGYAAYNNYDAGIVSYGLIQFTLAAGSLFSVIDRYLQHSSSPLAEQLRAYHARIRDRDPSLRSDETLRRLLVEAAKDQAMRQAQDEVATISYWNRVVEGYISHRGLKLPLTYALLFDMGVNFGTGHGFVRLAEEQLDVPLRSRPGENGITEEQLITRVAELRKQSHDRQAERDNLPGLRRRGDFWINLINKGDWGFRGESDGTVTVLGRKIRVADRP
jgi:hypothetical protein